MITFRYFPSPVHKEETTEAGPPVWVPGKTKCPRLTIEERDALVKASYPHDGDPRAPRRYAVRRGAGGIECFESRLTREHQEGIVEIHGFPVTKIPTRVLRRMRDDGVLSQHDYDELVARN